MSGRPAVSPPAGAMVAAALLPPLGIYLARGLGPSFWLGLALTMLFLVPGVLFAFAVLLRPSLLGGR